MADVRLSRSYIVAQLAHQLYNNKAIQAICEDDFMVVEEDNLHSLAHDLVTVFIRTLESAVIISDNQK